MAITARCCLNLPPRPRDSNSNIIDKSPSMPIRSREGDDADHHHHQRILGPSPSSSSLWKRRRCVLVMTCTTMMIMTTGDFMEYSTTGNYRNGLAAAAAMANIDSATATPTPTARWSEKIRGCPSWNSTSTYETVVPENLPRPSRPRRGWEAVSGTLTQKQGHSTTISSSSQSQVAPSVAAAVSNNNYGSSNCFSM